MKDHPGDEAVRLRLAEIQLLTGSEEQVAGQQYAKILETNPDNVVALGSAYSDLLAPDSPIRQRFAREDVQADYDIDLSRPTVLVGLSCHLTLLQRSQKVFVLRYK